MDKPKRWRMKNRSGQSPKPAYSQHTGKMKVVGTSQEYSGTYHSMAKVY